MLPSITSKGVTSALTSFTSVFGITDEIIIGNSSKFVAKVYHDFGSRYIFKFTTSSPHYPRGHGFTESQVQTIKNVFNKSAKDNSDPDLALLQEPLHLRAGHCLLMKY